MNAGRLEMKLISRFVVEWKEFHQNMFKYSEVTKVIWELIQNIIAHNLINNPKKFDLEIDDLGAKPCIPYKSLLQ